MSDYSVEGVIEMERYIAVLEKWIEDELDSNYSWEPERIKERIDGLKEEAKQ